MEIKKEIEYFRSQALMSRYQSAIKSGSQLLKRLEFLEEVFGQDFSQIQKQIKEEVDYCVQLSKFMIKDQIHNVQQQMLTKIQTVKLQNLPKSSWNKKGKSNIITESKSPISNTNRDQNVLQLQTDETETIQQKIHKNLILPLNMPMFKLKTSIFLIQTQNCINEVLEYLLHYDFKQFPSVHSCDLGVQNISIFKQEMETIGQKRGIIQLQNEAENKFTCSRRQIEKIKNVVEVYRESAQQGKNESKTVLVLLIEEESPTNLRKNLSLRHKVDNRKAINFL